MITNLVTYKKQDIAITGVCVAIDENTISLRYPVKDSDKVVDEKLSLLGCQLVLHTNRNITQGADARQMNCYMHPIEEGKEPIEFKFFNPFYKVKIVKEF